jgi:hypothetical protein
LFLRKSTIEHLESLPLQEDESSNSSADHK